MKKFIVKIVITGYLLSILISVLLISGILDLYLWITTKYLVPSWVISVLSFTSIGFISIIIYYIDKVEELEKINKKNQIRETNI